jgi:dual specificity tyrosine-phosphorylation-regulated kinase 2/3/4
MWSFGCIIAELLSCTPLFPAINEKELLEFFIIRIGYPPTEMVNACRKRKMFFDANGKLIRSKVSRIPPGCQPGSDSIRKFLKNEKDTRLVDFIEVSRRAIYKN